MHSHKSSTFSYETRRRFFDWLLTHRRWVLVASAAVISIGLIGASRVRVDVDVEQFIPAWGSARETYDDYKVLFSKEDRRFSVFWEADVPAHAELYDQLRGIADVFADAGLEDVQWIGGVDVADEEIIEDEATLRMRPLVERDSISDEYLRRVLRTNATDPLFLGYLWNADQTVFGVHGFLPEEWNYDLHRRAVEAELTERLESAGFGDRRWALSGIPVFRSRSPRLLQEDISLFLGGGLVLAFGLLWFGLGRLRLAALSLASVVPAYICTVGAMGLAGKPITMLTSFIPIVILVVGVSDAIHIVQHQQRECARGAGRAGVASTAGNLAVPCFYTSLTTAAGFASLAGTGIGIVMDFGLFTSLAIALSYVFSMTLLPVLLYQFAAESTGTRLHNRAGAAPHGTAEPVDTITQHSDRVLFGGIVAGAAGRSRMLSPVILGIFALASALCIVAGSGLRSNTFMVDDYKDTSPLVRDLRWIEDAGFGLFQINVFLRESGGEPLHHPDVLRWMREFQGVIADDPIVTSTMGPPDVFQQLRAAFVTGEPGHADLPTTREEASQLLLLAELEDQTFAEDIYRQHDGVAQIVFAIRDVGSAQMRPLLAQVERHLEQNPPPFGTATTTGIVSLVDTFTARLLRSFGPSLLLAGVVILGIMAVMLRSPTRALLAMIPNVFPLLVLLGIMRLGGFDLKPSTILVFSVAFGLAVDDTIHMLGRFRTEMNMGAGLDAALENTIRDVGPIMLLTSCLVGLGFALLMASQFQVLFLIGLLTVTSAAAAVLADLWLLPHILRIAHRVGGGIKSVVAVLAIAMGSAAISSPLAAQQRDDQMDQGAEIVRESDRRDTGWHDFRARMTMTLREGDSERQRELRVMMLEGTSDGDKTLVVFDGPADLRGTTLLAHTHREGPDDQWIYLPALRRAKRIASSSQSGSFMGSEFAYEDIGSQEFDKYTYRYLRDDVLEGIDVYVVERLPIDENSGYSRQAMWIDMAEYRVRRVDYYDRDNQHVKTLTIRGYRQYGERYWRPAEMRMSNVQDDRETVLNWEDYEFGVGLSDRDFDRRSLGRGP